MEPTIITAIIGAISTISVAIIGMFTARAKEKTNAELKEVLGKRGKSINHYLLFWWRGENDWAIKDW